METNNNPEENLHDLLNQATEVKAPTKNVSSHTWTIDDAEIIEETNTASNNPEQNNTDETTDPVKNPPEKKITDKAKRASARTVVNSIDLLQKSIFTPILSYKYNKKFTPEEINRLDDKNLVDLKKDELEGEDLMLRNKWDRLMKKYNKKVDEIPFTDPEKADMEEAFYCYFDYKETTVSPMFFVGMNVVNNIGKRAIDILTE